MRHGLRASMLALIVGFSPALLGSAEAIEKPAPPEQKSAERKPSGARAGGVPETILSPLGKKMTLKFHDEFDGVIDKDGQPYIDRSKWKTTFWQGSSCRTLTGNGKAQYYMDKAQTVCDFPAVPSVEDQTPAC